MKKVIKILFWFFLLAIVYKTCSSDKDNEVSIDSKKEEPNWSLYTPELKGRILNSNCQELQMEFDTAADNSDMQRARTGIGNLKLMNYIDYRMQSIGCY